MVKRKTSRPLFYKLDGKVAVPCDDLMEAATAFSEDDRRVQLTETELHAVSTVFLGVDHNHTRNGPPLLFETMVFERACMTDARENIQYDGELGVLKRYSTWEEAEAGHMLILGDVLRRERSAILAAEAAIYRKQSLD